MVKAIIHGKDSEVNRLEKVLDYYYNCEKTGKIKLDGMEKTVKIHLDLEEKETVDELERGKPCKESLKSE